MQKSQELLSKIAIYSKYARYNDELKRRESWEEICDRYKTMMVNKYPQLEEEIKKNIKLVTNKDVLMSMRMAQFAGPAVQKNESRGYNCAYLPITDLAAFNEAMLLLLGGTGVGYSVQQLHIAELPAIKKATVTQKYLVGDSIEGWADAVKALIHGYFGNRSAMPTFDYSDIREKGERLVTAGGKAPGPEPLRICLYRIDKILAEKKDGDHLSAIEAHDIMCHIADAVLAGGIRRAALISLFSFNDEEMLNSKQGKWYVDAPWRARANNSAVFDRKTVTKEQFNLAWKRVQDSDSGEPGIYFTNDLDWGTNPCCFTGDMRLLTSEGYKSFTSLNNKSGMAYNKDMKLVPFKVWSNGIKKVIRLNFSDGSSLKCTPDHKLMDSENNIIEAKDTLNKLLFRLQDVVSIEEISNEEVFDFSLDDDTHWGIVEDVLAHNCEIALKPFQFCNLTEINGSRCTTQEELNELARVAAFFGTLQAGFIDFHYLRPIWKTTTETDALIGVGITGICNGSIIPLDLQEAAGVVKEENERISKIIGINSAARTTTIKPSGTTSCVLGTSSGIHAWHSQYYVRNMQCKLGDYLHTFFTENYPMLVKTMDWDKTSAVIGLPQKAPETAILRETENALTMLDRVKRFNLEWVREGHRSGKNTNNVSATVSISSKQLYLFDEFEEKYVESESPFPNTVDEWQVVGEWMWNNRNNFNGLSVLPYDGGVYADAPFQEITEEQYLEKMKFVPDDITFDEIVEDVDLTNLAGELACAGGSCEIT